jgi:diguanylate cyclase (GGDEF)-like protein
VRRAFFRRRAPASDPTPFTFWGQAQKVIGEQPLWLLGVEAAAMLLLVAWADFATGTDLGFSVFYLVPVVFLGWFVHRAAALTFAALSAVLWVGADTLAGVHYTSLFVPAWNSFVRLLFFVITLLLVESSRNAHDRERALARTDSLTGVANGRRFQDRANLALATLRRSGRPFTVAYMDLDEFKSVNDTAGHIEGDRLLRSVAQAIDGRLRDTDMVARLGGDEFAILLDDTGQETARSVLKDISSTVEQAVEGHSHVTATVGVVTFTEAPDSVDAMLMLADRLMYRGKRDGRHRIESDTWPHEDRAADRDASAR